MLIVAFGDLALFVVLDTKCKKIRVVKLDMRLNSVAAKLATKQFQ